MDPPKSPKVMALKLAPNPPYRIPSTVVGSDSPSTIPSTPTSQPQLLTPRLRMIWLWLP